MNQPLKTYVVESQTGVVHRVKGTEAHLSHGVPYLSIIRPVSGKESDFSLEDQSTVYLKNDRLFEVVGNFERFKAFSCIDESTPSSSGWYNWRRLAWCAFWGALLIPNVAFLIVYWEFIF